MHWRRTILRRIAEEQVPTTTKQPSEPESAIVAPEETSKQPIPTPPVPIAAPPGSSNLPISTTPSPVPAAELPVEPKPATLDSNAVAEEINRQLEESFNKLPAPFATTDPQRIFDHLFHFYNLWQDRRFPGPGRDISAQSFAFHLLLQKAVDSKNPFAATAMERLVKALGRHNGFESVLFALATVGYQAEAVIPYMLEVAPKASGMYGWGRYIRTWITEGKPLHTIEKLIRAYQGVDSVVYEIYDDIADCYLEGDHPTIDELAATTIDISSLLRRIAERGGQDGGPENTKALLNRFMDRISAKALLSRFNTVAHDDREFALELFTHYLPMKPEIDRVGLILKSSESDDEHEYELPDSLLDQMTQHLNAEETKQLQDRISSSSVLHLNQAVLAGLLVNPHVDKPTIYGFIGQKRTGRYVLQQFVQSQQPPAEVDSSIDMPLLQQAIERSNNLNDVRYLAECSDTYRTINFASAKRKFNELFGKEIVTETEERKQMGLSPDPTHIIELRTQRIVDTFTSSYGSAIAKAFIDIVVSKKDWFFLNEQICRNLLANQTTRRYGETNPEKAAMAIYQAVKGDYKLVDECRQLNDAFTGNYRTEFQRLTHEESDVLPAILQRSQNFTQFVRYCERMKDAAVLMHNSNLPGPIARQCILNPGINLKDKTIEEFLELVGQVSELRGHISPNHTPEQASSAMRMNLSEQIREMTAVNPRLIDEKAFFANLTVFDGLKQRLNAGEGISFKRGTDQYNAVKQLHTQLAIMTQFESIREHITEAKPKDHRLADLNWTHPSGLRFETLGYLDPKAFSVGADTDCCQRIGGVGEQAAIDSFTNPLASVLICSWGDELIGQSYCHVVPSSDGKQFGVILDNVEVSDKALKAAGLTEAQLTRAYADWAHATKQAHSEVSYVLCGKSYNKLDNGSFGAAPKFDEDPRSFAVEEPYSDWDEDDSLDLLQPSKQLEQVAVTPKRAKQANETVVGLTRRMIRRMAMMARMDGLDRFAQQLP